MRVTMKADTIEYDVNLPKLFAWGIYDTKPARLLSCFTEKITLTTKKRDKAKDVFFGIDYLRFNIVGDFSYGMGGFNMYEQLRLQYRV